MHLVSWEVFCLRLGSESVTERLGIAQTHERSDAGEDDSEDGPGEKNDEGGNDEHLYSTIHGVATLGREGVGHCGLLEA